MIVFRNHPFSVDALLEYSIVLTFAVPKEDIASLIPDPFTLDTYQDTFAFVAVAMVKTRKLRPAILPAFLGTDFFLIGYRVFVRYRNRAGANLRGLYILRSETDSTIMKLLGGLFTRYSYIKTNIRVSEDQGGLSINAMDSGFNVVTGREAEGAALPTGSPFLTWKEARRFAGPLPFTFTTDQKSKTVLIVEGQRENWVPKPLTIHSYDIPFLNQPVFNQKVLANAFIIRDIHYHWKKGKTEQW
jgi:hypothetical protein